jgi:hypothetical protein
MRHEVIDRKRRTVTGALVAFLVTAISSGCVGPQVVVTPSGPGVVATPKPPDCQVEFFRTKVDRPYDEIAALHAWGGDTFKTGPDYFRDALRAKACELGADALIVTQDYSWGYSGSGQGFAQMNAAAIKYRDAASGPR